MKYKLEEQETMIHYDPFDKKWLYETSYAPHIKNILDLLSESPDAFINIKKDFDEDHNVVHISVTASNVDSIPMPANKFGKSMLPKKKRELTTAQREKLNQQLAKGRKTQGID